MHIKSQLLVNAVCFFQIHWISLNLDISYIPTSQQRHGKDEDRSSDDSDSDSDDEEGSDDGSNRSNGDEARRCRASPRKTMELQPRHVINVVVSAATHGYKWWFHLNIGDLGMLNWLQIQEMVVDALALHEGSATTSRMLMEKRMRTTRQTPQKLAAFGNDKPFVTENGKFLMCWICK